MLLLSMGSRLSKTLTPLIGQETGFSVTENSARDSRRDVFVFRAWPHHQCWNEILQKYLKSYLKQSSKNNKFHDYADPGYMVSRRIVGSSVVNGTNTTDFSSSFVKSTFRLRNANVARNNRALLPLRLAGKETSFHRRVPHNYDAVETTSVKKKSVVLLFVDSCVSRRCGCRQQLQ